MLEINQTYIGDCLQVMQSIDDSSVDMILSDLPYGKTRCKWDVPIDLESLWKQYLRVIKHDGAIVLTAIEPFTSILVMSMLSCFKYKWVWKKSRQSRFQQVAYMPLRITEDVLVFSITCPKYNPQNLVQREKLCLNSAKHIRGNREKNNGEMSSSALDGNVQQYYTSHFTNYPNELLEFKNETKGILQTTQKPVALFEYLVRTYTDENELVLDNCAGSGTTGVACLNSNRRFILIEKDAKMAQKCAKRVAQHYQQLFGV